MIVSLDESHESHVTRCGSHGTACDPRDAPLPPPRPLGPSSREEASDYAGSSSPSKFLEGNGRSDSSPNLFADALAPDPSLVSRAFLPNGECCDFLILLFCCFCLDVVIFCFDVVIISMFGELQVLCVGFRTGKWVKIAIF